MIQNINNSKEAIIIGRDANGAEIKIDFSELDKLKKTPKWTYWVWLISVVALGLSISAIFISADMKCNVEVVSISIILGFVGILATFVVISNYVQGRRQNECIN